MGLIGESSAKMPWWEYVSTLVPPLLGVPAIGNRNNTIDNNLPEQNPMLLLLRNAKQ
jgi:hypothetical protein